MQSSIKYFSCKDFSITVENLMLKLIVDFPIKESKKNEVPITMHDHSMHELFVCGEGEIFLDLPNERLKLSAGEAAIIPKGISHTKAPDNQNAEWIAIRFSCRGISGGSFDLYREISRIANGNSIVVFKNANEIYNEVSGIIKLSSASHPMLPAMRMLELLISCSGKDYTEILPIEPSASSEADTDIRRIDKLDQIIHNNYAEPLTSAEIADQLFISIRQLDRISKKRYGGPIHRVIMDRRITTAEKMLLEGDMSVESIGSSVGFSSHSGFYREFERKHGMTPTEYRKRNKTAR